jgi:hypothetical protein
MTDGQLALAAAAPAADGLLPAPPGWPDAPAAAAFTGLAGDIVAAIAPNTEADPVAILGQLLIAYGSAVGRGAWFQIEATRHYPNEFVIVVGESSRARKGSSWDRVAGLLAAADPGFAGRLATGLASGEGLVWHARDPAPDSAERRDPRLLVLEPEFAAVVKATNRDQSTLSPVLRCAWDSRPLQLLTRTAPARASHAHISVIGHITATELRHHVTTLELANGLLNRFLFLLVRRVRLLPEGGHPDPLHGTDLPDQLTRHLARGRSAGHLHLDDATRRLWHDIYARLTEPANDLAGAVCARAEAHVLRLALIYALINGHRAIRAEDLHAALALHDYAARSATWTLADHSGDPLAEQLHAALATHPDGLTRTQLRDLLHRNQPAGRIHDALEELAATGRATRHTRRTGGRPAETWTATVPPPAVTPAARTQRAAQP